MTPEPESLLAYCRAGFERECAQELTAFAASRGVEGFVKARPDSGHAVFCTHDPDAARRLGAQIDLADLVFARQVVRSARLVAGLPPGDRTGPLVEATRCLGRRFSAIRLEMPDTNEGKALSALTRPLAVHLERALRRDGVVLDDAAAPERLHFFFVGGAACHVGVSDARCGSPWPNGIPRLRMPRGAPSRSTLKLAEAFQVFLGEAGEQRLLQPGMSAVDLGAAPGGWTWQLVRRHLRVTAVDNGPLEPALLETGLVVARKADGLTYRPPAPVDWMVCDMIEQPSRIAALAGRWLSSGWCRQSIFNLKLPMKKRWEEVLRSRESIAGALAGKPHTLRLKQLYHDREEVTAYLALAGQSR